MASAPNLILTNISKYYGDRPALDSVCLSANLGNFIALAGMSGSGKTTLLKVINRLIQPDGGEILIAGQSANQLPAPLWRRQIGYAIQGTGLFPHMTVAENIAIVPRLSGSPRKDEAGRVAELLDLVELPRDFAARMPRELSGGQAQRVGLARALAARPRIMLMDEPFGALDPGTRESLGASYRALHERLGLTTIMVTHDMAEALLLADRVVLMEQGRIRADDTPQALLRGDAGEDVRTIMSAPVRQAERLAALAPAR